MYSNFHINQRNFVTHLKRIFAKVLQNVWFVFAHYLSIHVLFNILYFSISKISSSDIRHKNSVQRLDLTTFCRISWITGILGGVTLRSQYSGELWETSWQVERKIAWRIRTTIQKVYASIFSEGGKHRPRQVRQFADFLSKGLSLDYEKRCAKAKRRRRTYAAGISQSEC